MFQLAMVFINVISPKNNFGLAAIFMNLVIFDRTLLLSCFKENNGTSTLFFSRLSIGCITDQSFPIITVTCRTKY